MLFAELDYRKYFFPTPTCSRKWIALGGEGLAVFFVKRGCKREFIVGIFYRAVNLEGIPFLLSNTIFRLVVISRITCWGFST